MPSIGIVSCDFLHGAIPPLMTQASERWHVPGLDGDGLILLGATGMAFGLRAVFYNTKSSVLASIASLQGLAGSSQTVINDLGQTFLVYIERVGVPQVGAARVPGGSITTKGEIEVACVRL